MMATSSELQDVMLTIPVYGKRGMTAVKARQPEVMTRCWCQELLGEAMENDPGQLCN